MTTQNPNETLVKQTTDVLDPNGRDLNSRESPLAKIFDQIESGVSRDEAIKSVNENKPVEQKQDKPEENKIDQPIAEPKKEEAEVVVTPEPTDLEKRLGVIDEKKRQDAAKPKEEAKPKEDAAKPTTEASQDEVTDEDLRVLPHDKPKTAKRIDALLKRATALQEQEALTKKEVEARDLKIKEMEAELAKVKSASPEVNDEIKAQIDELRQFRRRYKLESDPEVKDKFDNRIVKAEESIAEIFKRRGGEGIVKIIQEEGGWLKFADSSRVINLKDGNKMTAAEIADAVRGELSLSERRTLDALEIEQVQTKREKERFFEEETRKASDYFKQQEEAARKQQEEAKAKNEQVVKTVTEWRTSLAKDNPWLAEKPITGDLPPEKRAEIEEDNRYTKQINSLIDKALSTTEPQEMLNIVLDSAKYWNERRAHQKTLARIAQLEQQLKTREEEVKKIKTAGSATARSGSLSAGSSSSVSTAPKKPTSLEEAFGMIEEKGSIE